MAVGPPIVLGHQHFWTTPEEVGERQPVALEVAGLELVFDGRLDNREELLRTLEIRDSSTSDAALVLHAYAKWGEGCFGRLLGPFALAIFDRRSQHLVLARDVMGDRTLYYRLLPRIALVASEECALLAHPDVGSNLNEETLAHYFAVNVPGDGSTFFKEISELLPAHVLVVSTRSARMRRYWAPDLDQRIWRQSDESYAEEFLSLLTESVRCCLRAVGPVGAELSGGMDSTAVAGLAAELLSRRGGEPLRTFSWVFDELKECDERPWIGSMVERFRLDATYVIADDAWPLRDLRICSVGSNQPWKNCHEDVRQLLYGAAAQRGCRTLLTGGFADCFYIGDEEWLTDLLRDGRLDLMSQFVVQALRSEGISGLLAAPGLRRLGRTVLRRPLEESSDLSGSPWLTGYARGLIRSSHENDPLAPRARRPGQYEAVHGPFTRLNANIAQHTHSHKVELRDPFLDRRLSDFMLGIPAYQLHRNGHSKFIQRNAMSRLLPRAIRERTAVTSLRPLFNRGMERGIDIMSRNLTAREAIWRPYVSEDWIRDAFPARTPVMRGRASLVPWQCLSAQIWSDSRSRDKLKC
ncbi:MAG: hypothetical protein IT186_25750 [Acidobacteria bacterium]|nr:hypothetical protein [Acidobacteriota bacterium]